MRVPYLRKLTAALCATLVAGFVNSASTQPKAHDRGLDWRIECNVQLVNQNVCALTQTLVSAETGKRVLELVLRRVGKDRKLALTVVTPLDVFLAAGIAAKVDGGEQFNLVWQRCTAQGCQAMVAVDATLEKALKAGRHLLVGFKNKANAEAVTVSASLKGIAQGIRALDRR